MQKTHFNTTINASPEKVWSVLWGKDTYPKWTAAFSEGSDVEGDFSKGSQVIFFDKSRNGMVSLVTENIPNEYLGLEHLGTYKDGVKDFDSPEVKKWAGAQENYKLQSEGGKTTLSIEQDMLESDKAMMEQAWPKALEALKALAEK